MKKGKEKRYGALTKRFGQGLGRKLDWRKNFSEKKGFESREQ